MLLTKHQIFKIPKEMHYLSRLKNLLAIHRTSIEEIQPKTLKERSFQSQLWFIIKWKIICWIRMVLLAPDIIMGQTETKTTWCQKRISKSISIHFYLTITISPASGVVWKKWRALVLTAPKTVWHRLYKTKWTAWRPARSSMMATMTNICWKRKTPKIIVKW